MQSRRAVLGAIGAGTLAGTAGCLDAIPFLGSDPMTFEASASTIPSSVLDDTGYEEYRRQEMVVEQTVEAGSQTQDVVVTNQQVEYDKAVDLGQVGLPVEERVRAATVTALTTPQVDVLGRTINPVGDMDSAELANTVQGRYAGIGDLEQVGEATAPVAGESTTVTEFEGSGDLTGAGVTVDLTLHVAEAVEAGDDLIVAVGSYPTGLQDQEREDTFAMFDGIEHGG